MLPTLIPPISAAGDSAKKRPSERLLPAETVATIPSWLVIRSSTTCDGLALSQPERPPIESVTTSTLSFVAAVKAATSWTKRWFSTRSYIKRGQARTYDIFRNAARATEDLVVTYLDVRSDTAEAERIGESADCSGDVRSVVRAVDIRVGTGRVHRVVATERDVAAGTEAAAEDGVEVVDACVEDANLDRVRAEDALVVQLVYAGHDVRIEGVVEIGRCGREGRPAALCERRGEGGGEGCRTRRDASAFVFVDHGGGARKDTERPGAGDAVDALELLEDLLDSRLTPFLELLKEGRIGDFDDGAVEERGTSGERARG